MMTAAAAAAATPSPGLPSAWWDAALADRTPYLLALLALTAALARWLPPRDGARPRLRLPLALTAAHLALITVAAALRGAGYDTHLYLLAAFACALFAGLALVAPLAFRLVLPRLGLTVPRILVDIVTALGVVVVLIAVGRRAGFSVAGLITTSAVLTAVVGFALQDTLGNVMGGLALQLDRSINVGDWISLGPGQPTGRVVEIRWRYTALETVAWTTVIVPNSALMKAQVTVLGRRQGEPPYVRREVEFGVDPGRAPGEVAEIVRAALAATPVERMAAEPPVAVLFAGLREGVAWYRVRYWLTDLSAEELTDSEVRTRAFYALRRAGLGFAVPSQTLLITADDAARDARRHDTELVRRLDALGRVDLLAVLGDGERRQVAATLRYAPFARGEAMTREGEHDDGLYMIVEGEAAVQLRFGDAAAEVARLTAGQFFGEMSLLTGERRAATVVAMTDVVTYRLDKPAFEALVQSRPEIADAVAELLTERRLRLDAARDQLEDDAARARHRATTRHDLLGRVRGFFNLGAPR